MEGRIEYDSFERNGVTIPTAEVVVRELVLLGGSRPALSGARREEAFSGDEEGEDLPF